MRKNGWTDLSTKEEIAFEKKHPAGKTLIKAVKKPYDFMSNTAGESAHEFVHELMDEQGHAAWPTVMDEKVRWADWDKHGRLLTAREGFMRAYKLGDLKTGRPSFELDCNDFQPPV